MSTPPSNTFSFLPWVKNTLTRKAASSPSSLRPVIPVTLSLAVGGGGSPTQNVQRDVAVHGPGDVIGLQPEAVLKTTPLAGEQQYPALQLASIEFGEEDLPWRYSPEQVPAAGGNSQWAPWCFLLVLKTGATANEFVLLPQGNAPLPSIKVTNLTTAFPEVATRWAWAHVQTAVELGNQTGGMSAANVADFLAVDLKANPDLAFSRVLSPRRLEANTDYQAFLVPAYETGRLAGLGLPFPTGLTATLCAWGAVQGYTRPPESATAFPVYYQWSFRTSQAVDFEALARLLQPEVAVDFGTQPLSLTTPLSSAGSATPPNRQYILDLPGVMQEPGAPVMSVPAPIATDFYTTLKPVASQPRPLRPLVTPPIYGQTYAATTPLHDPRQTAPTNWLDQVNLHPGYRSMAAIGSQVIQDNQEEYMQRAWEQVRDIIVANANLRGMQSGLETTDSLRQQHLPLTGTSGNRAGVVRASAPVMITTQNKQRNAAGKTSPLMARAAATVGNDGSMENYGLHLTGMSFTRILDPETKLTLQETVRQSNVPLAAFTPTFRRVLKPFGRYQTNLAGHPQRPTLPESVAVDTLLGHDQNLRQRDALLTLLADGKITAAPPKFKNLLGYQFNDDDIQIILESKDTRGLALWVYVPGGEGSHYAITDGAVYQNFMAAYGTFSAVKFPPPPEPKQPPLDLGSLKQAVIDGTRPGPVFLARANRAIRFLPHYGTYAPRSSAAVTSGLASGVAARSLVSAVAAPPAAPQLKAVQPVMAYPVFKDPMGPILQQRHPELFLPNAGDFPPNAVTLLQYNRAFIESYLLGLNHAFGSELLWRNYPTDLRGSYFRQFWNVSEYLHLNPPPSTSPDGPTPAELAVQEEAYRDVKPLATWGQGALGLNPAPGSPNPPLLLAVRGDLLKRYPTAVVCAARGMRDTAQNLVPDLSNVKYPTHRSTLGEDILLFSFDLTPETVKGNFNASPADYGYFFVFHERPGEPQFGLDLSGPSSPFQRWDDLSWSAINTAPGQNITQAKLTSVHVTAPTAGSFADITSSAHFAYAVFQKPFLVAFHAQSMMRP